MSGHRKTLAIRKAQMAAYLESIQELAQSVADGDCNYINHTVLERGEGNVGLSEDGGGARLRTRSSADSSSGDRHGERVKASGGMDHGGKRRRARSIRGHGAGAMPEVDPDRVRRRGLRLEHERQYMRQKNQGKEQQSGKDGL